MFLGDYIMGKNFLPSTMADSFAAYNSLGCQHSFLDLKYTAPGSSDFQSSTERPAIILMGFSLCMICVFFSFSFQYTFFVLQI